MKWIFVSLLSALTILSFATVANAAGSTLPSLPTTSIDYELPYPGLLPDNPLYPLKAFRDKIVSFFITDAQKQATFDLLQADKRLAAAQYLLAEHDHSKDTLISSTVSKGENYFDDAIVNTAKAQSEGRVMNDFINRLTTAGIKHQQILYMMATQTQGQLRQNLAAEILRVQGFENRVNKLKQQP